MEVQNFFKSLAGKRIMVIMALGAIIGLAVLVIMMRPAAREEARDIITEVYDPISGDTFREVDQEPEEPFDGAHLVGFGVFVDIGFTSQQSHIIFTTVREFFFQRHPDINRLSVERGSIEYDVANEDITYFRLVSDAGDVFRVRIDTEGSMLRASLSFFDGAGNPLN